MGRRAGHLRGARLRARDRRVGMGLFAPFVQTEAGHDALAGLRLTEASVERVPHSATSAPRLDPRLMTFNKGSRLADGGAKTIPIMIVPENWFAEFKDKQKD